MEILFLAHRIPYPPDRGDKIRSWHLLKHLATLGRVHLACFADDEADAAHLPALREALGSALGEAHVEVRRRSTISAGARALIQGKPVSLTLFDSASLRAFVERLVASRRIETVFAFSGQMAQFVPAGAHRFIMDFGDVDSAKFAGYAQQGRGPMRWVNRREARKLSAFERQVAARADISLFVSEAEAAFFRSRTGLPQADVRALSNGIDTDFFNPDGSFEPAPPASGPLIVFTGQMDYRPNVEAVRAFACEAMPFVRQSHPEVRFAIVGRNPAEPVRELEGLHGTLVTGAVADVRGWLAAADVVVAPLRIARGIQNKVLEAMAMARPVVASPAAFEGIEAVAGKDLLVAETSGDQAALASALLADSQRAGAIGNAARARVLEAYRWESRLGPLAGMIGLAERAAA